MRRRYFAMGLGVLGATIAAQGITYPSWQQDDSAVLAPSQAPLRQQASQYDLFFGSAVQRKDLEFDPIFSQLFAKECNILVPETALKWRRLQPEPDAYQFADADWLLEYASAHNIKVRGHTLVWHEGLPNWLATTSLTPKTAERYLTEHIQTVMGHFRGKIHSWDVVNEAVRPDHNQVRGLRQTLWFDALGPSYIERAFRVAYETDSSAMLVYNDFGMEYDTSWANQKRNAVLSLLRHLKARDVPIHALGMQSHLMRYQAAFHPQKLRRFLADVASLGLKILITELDVTDQQFASDIPTRDREVAAVYKEYLQVVLDEPAVIAVLTWGLSDRHTWISNNAPRQDGTVVRPLPFDEYLNRKPAWSAIASAFQARATSSP